MRVLASVGERDVPDHEPQNSLLSVRAFVRIQIRPLLAILRQHIQRISPSLAYHSGNPTSRTAARLNTEVTAIRSIISYLEIAVTLADNLP
jgi:hypothetical protein